MIEKPVVGLGQCSWDILGQIETYPAVDRKTDLLNVSEQGGGPVATALVTLSRLGCKTQFMGSVGGDRYARQIADSLAGDGVDTGQLRIDQDGTSQFAFIAIEWQSGRRNIFCNRGARRPFCFDQRARDSIAKAAALLLDGGEPAAALEAAKFARSQKVPVILDGGSLNHRIQELLPHCDHLVVGQHFAEQLGAGSSAGSIERLLQFGAQAAVVTLGAAGCLGRQRDGELQACPAFAVPVIDTTGCGDVFHGAYAYALLNGYAWPNLLRFASACAALKACSIGGRRGIPSLDRVNQLLAS
jgi:sulfofructose kinase